HEREHEVREAQKAEDNGQKVVSSQVSIYMDQCPECKKMYASGGKAEITKSGGGEVKDPILSGIVDLFKAAQSDFAGSTTGQYLNSVA
ncbi:MAG: hypothetical protein FWD35_06380, partial [Oscillospiraceae bacterium]|nr:hypothetical protein [Oscillospiraceae bacterium]